MSALPLVIPFAERAASLEVGQLGGKAANLARMSRLGFEVPPWFVIPTDVFTTALGPVLAEIQDLIRPVRWDDPAQIKQISLTIHDRIKKCKWPDPVRAAILGAYRNLIGDSAGSHVAVRSSAVGEDSATQSFAGQMDTFLFVKGEESLLNAIQGCWASGYSDRAMAYRHQNGIPPGDVRMAVVIQEMVFGDVSGVLFTANAINGNTDELVLSATYGLGEGLVSGELDADNWIVDRPTRGIRPEITTKAEQIVFDTAKGQGTIKAAVAKDLQDRPCLPDAQVLALADLGDDIAAKLGGPQDIEWTVKGARIYLLQTRPITTLKPRPKGAKRLWDNSNIAESYYGVTTPLTFSFVRRMYEVAYQVLFDAFGIPHQVLRDNQGVFANLLGLLNGRIYYNLGNYYKLVTFLPAYEVLKDFFDTMIGVQEQRTLDRPPPGERLKAVPRIAFLAGRILGSFFAWDREVAEFTRTFNKQFADFRDRDYAGADPDKSLEAYRELERTMLWGWRAPMTNDFFAMVFFGLLKKLVASWKLDESGSLHNDLLCGEGGLESTEPAKALIRLALTVRKDPTLRKVFETSAVADVGAKLAEHPGFQAELQHYLTSYGYRCMGELKLEVRNLIEDPTFVFAMIKNYLAMENLDLADMESKERGIRDIAEAQVRRRIGYGPRRILFGWILKNARKGVRYRENLRMARTKAFGLVRQIFQGIAAQLTHLGALGEADDVFYLELDEVFAFVEGRAVSTNLKGLVAMRKAEFAEYERLPVNDRLETIGPVYMGDQLYTQAIEVDDGSPILKGTSCCPGRVKSPARVILKPSDQLRLNGEILVTERTDPGWVPLYPSASGLLIERGSLLSHAAVVARELGLPTIIGVKNLIKRVQDGQWVDMDARAGTVRLDVAPGEDAPVLAGAEAL